MKSIPVDKLQNKTNAGLQIKVFGPGYEPRNNGEAAYAHRDDHYIFFLLTNGSGTLKVDLQSPPGIQVPYSLTPLELKQYTTLLGLLLDEYVERRNDKYYLSIVHMLIQSFLAMAASTYDPIETRDNKHTRSVELARQFKKGMQITPTSVAFFAPYQTYDFAITGAGSGFGFEAAMRLAEKGFDVIAAFQWRLFDLSKC